MRAKKWMKRLRICTELRLGKIMKCLCSGEQLRADEMVPSSESLATRDYSASGYSSKAGESEQKPDTGNIEEAESSLRESGCLNYEEARALLGRLEYQRGNVQAALHVFEGIDIAAVTQRIKFSIAQRKERRRRHSQSDVSPPMPMHAVSLLFEAIFLKAKSLQDLGRFQEAAQSCKIILDTVESALPEGFPENMGTDCKLQETLNRAVELLPELWKLAGFPHEAILSYRHALLHHWSLDAETTAKIQKDFAIFLLYGGYDASPPDLRSQMEGSFVPRNNIEEAILLLFILLRKFALKRIEWDPSIMDHLSFALSVSGELRALANQIEESLPGSMDRKERYYTLALCYHAEGENVVALNLLRKLLTSRENPNSMAALLLASKICVENLNLPQEGEAFACRAIAPLQGECNQMGSVTNYLLGVSLSAQARSSGSDYDRSIRQAKALEALEAAEKEMREREPRVIFYLSLENAEQRKLDVALNYAKQLLKLEAGSNVKGWILLARILSAQKRFGDAETIINAALDQTGRWDQGELLRTKAKLQIAQGQLKNAVETYTHLLAVLQVQSKSFGVSKKLLKKNRDRDRSLEMETWHDLAHVYISLSQWRDAEVCLSKSKAINPHSASRWHTTGLLHEAKGLHKEALKAFSGALDIEPTHVPSLVSTAIVLRKLGEQSLAVVRGFLTDALRLDRTNHSAWYNLGLLCKAEGGSLLSETADCFEAATFLEESAPVEPFR
ncbi:PREDICTED: tetratricopeptide repeat protein 7A-like [Nelumbo nucifera]|uniref:Tetratricopeptide repeat protein 7A-like n=2 Tax=Nelumbo nucifera TaxID=4432 RepID=A0A1U8Q530_NELNU|nr:PREDICTED: tetratricopeptide repeat protein 7A-like [Nelumbo nucifera]XP_019053913.1 PREDICTED: tetratricopeptide repeat protein 7A-like [Nelumbo nucifera]DAD36839.1 TPA_asm: hypothetical protein HUJ06_007480 [Nelumbo nucifera]